MISECLNANFAALRVALAAWLIVAVFIVNAVAGASEEGVHAYNRGDYATAMRNLRPLAERGDANAQAFVGFMYQGGHGVRRSSAQAALWYRRAADQGLAVAQSSLGTMYFLGDDVPQNYADAIKWWLKAAAQGDAAAQLGLGTIYKEGHGVPQNYILAYMWFTSASQIPGWEGTGKHDLDEILPHMAPSQIAEAQGLAQQCVQSNYMDCNQATQVAHIDDKIASSTAANHNLSSRMGVPLKMDKGIFVVPVEINGTMTLDFAIDSGAADVSVPADVFSALKRTGTVKEADFTGQRTYVLADGSKSQSATFTIRSLKVGDVVLENVTASVASSQGSLLLGQSFLKRFKSWSIDNMKHELRLELL
jgi:clan AA aspartic protease (TIGR02281 family)